MAETLLACLSYLLVGLGIPAAFLLWTIKKTNLRQKNPEKKAITGRPCRATPKLQNSFSNE
jgi:hypothetical protein